MMEFDDIVVKESPGLCRCCLSEGCYKDLGTEYTWMNETEVYADMLLECFDISITQQNDGPNGANRLICEVCITRLRDACNFKKQVLDSEKKFIDMIGRGEFRPKVVIYQAQMKSEDIVEESEDAAIDAAEVEYLEDELDFGEDEIMKDTTAEPSVSDITVATLPVKGKRGRPRKAAAEKPEKRLKLSEEKPKPSKQPVKDSDTEPKHSVCSLRRRNLQILFNNTTLIPFKWRGKYMCFYCGDDLNTYELLRKHTKGHGICTDRDRAIRLVKTGDSEVKIDVSDISCEICLESFLSTDDIIKHLISKHGLPYNKDIDLTLTAYRLIDLQCLLCDKSFNYLRKLISHVNNDHPNNCFLCPQCNQKFNKKRDLNGHLRDFHKSDYTCDKCDKNFPTNYTLQYHKSHSHSSSCNICFETFKSDSKRLLHMKINHNTHENKCGFCNKTMNTKQAFLRHATRCSAVHTSKEETIIADDDDKKHPVKQMRDRLACIFNMSTALPFKFFMNRFRCFYCSKDFTDCQQLKDHTIFTHPHCDITFKSMKLKNRYDGVQIKIDTSALACKLCGLSLETIDDLIDHLTKVHNADCAISVESILQSFKLIKDNFPCPICGEIYRYFGLLLKHVSARHSDNKHICMYCGKPFRRDPNLRAHVIRCHKSAGNYKCSNCDLTFLTNNDLKTHQGGVHGDKIVQCSECSEKFISRYSMQRHLLISHATGYKCSYCGKLFIKNSFMVNHIRRCHLKEKNVECSICFVKFFDGQRLKMHMVKHVGERNFHCDVCGKKFLWKRNLRGHMASHVRNAHGRNAT